MLPSRSWAHKWPTISISPVADKVCQPIRPNLISKNAETLHRYLYLGCPLANTHGNLFRRRVLRGVGFASLIFWKSDFDLNKPATRSEFLWKFINLCDASFLIESKFFVKQNPNFRALALLSSYFNVCRWTAGKGHGKRHRQPRTTSISTGAAIHSLQTLLSHRRYLERQKPTSEGRGRIRGRRIHFYPSCL
jgi:hypothetical protein